VVWWSGPVGGEVGSGGSNGVVEYHGEALSNIVALTAAGGGALLLTSDGVVFDWRTTLNEPCELLHLNGQPLTNVVSVSAYAGGALAFRRDGTVVGCDPWGRNAEVLHGLTNVISVAKATNGRLVAVRRDGTVVYRVSLAGWGYLTEELDSIPTKVVSVGDRPLTNVVALTEAPGPLADCLALRRDGTVLAVRFQAIDSAMAFTGMTQESISASLVRLDGEVLTNVVAVTQCAGHCRALKSDGTVVAWCELDRRRDSLPQKLGGLTALVPCGDLALGRDGTVVAWGGDTNVPAGLDGVIAIAECGNCRLALTTNAALPSGVFIPPHGRLEEMEREAGLVFKGRALSTRAITNTLFPPWGNPHATRLEVSSVLKGSVRTNVLVFQHNTSGPNAWGGGTPPPHYNFETGQSYLVFAEKTGNPDEFRQLSPMLKSETDGVTRTLDSRPLPRLTVKEAHWLELSRLLTNQVPTNALYAIQRLNVMSDSCLDPWGNTGDFKREAVLEALLPLVAHSIDRVAIAAIGCFQLGGNTGTSVPDQGRWVPILRGC
jgi:hypothetical protein